jgi:hypothetical protein
MIGSWEYLKGHRFVLRDDRHEWTIDRASGQVQTAHQSLIGRKTAYTFPLADLVGVTLQLSPAPPMTVSVALGLLSAAFDASKRGVTTPEALAVETPKGLAGRLDERTSDGPPRATSATFAVHGLDRDRDMVLLAHQMAEIGGLRYAGVFSIPHVGVEVRLARDPAPRLEQLPTEFDATTAGRYADEALAHVGPPPFEPHRFPSEYTVADWRPGQRVAFRRPLSPWALAIFPFTLLLLTGPAIIVMALMTGRDLNVTNTIILSVVAAAFGIPSLALFLGMLPRAVEFDWPENTLSIRRWLRHRRLRLDRIRGLEAHARFYESSGDGGGSSRSYACELKAQVQDEDNGRPVIVDLLETRMHSDPDVPTRQAFALASELASALHVSCRIQDYSFRRSRGSAGDDGLKGP